MFDIASILFAGATGLLVIGIGGMVLSEHLYRMLLALAIAEAGANLMLVLAGFKWSASAPIITVSVESIPAMVDPVPQAMVLTAIVIGVGVQALALTMIIRIRNAYGTLNMREVKLKMEQEFADMADLPIETRSVPARNDQS
ncbi:MAG: Na+/H+ antiporter subunit C [Gammaproteobacteria bacterium]|nr:Na+/H+ antiporter subunit C [Gammaproteobacteria bacterium]